MNLVKVCPNIPDEWRGNLTDTAKILGICVNTLRHYATLGRRGGGIDSKAKPNGKRGKTFIGKEVKRFWKEYS